MPEWPPRPSRLVVAVLATGLLVGACGFGAEAGSDAPATAMAFIHAIGHRDGAAACALMSRDYQSQGFVSDGVPDGSTCLEHFAGLIKDFPDDEAAEFASATIVDIDFSNPARTIIRTSGPDYPHLIEVIREDGQSKVDDSRTP